MTFRFLTLATAVGALALAGCGDSAGGSGGSANVDLDDLANADPFDQLAYNSGHGAAGQFLSQYDSTFSYDLFAKGFRDGAAGDSAQIAYALGLRAGLELRADTVSNINADVFLAGLREGLDGDSLRLTTPQLERAFEVVQDSMGKRQERAEMAQLRSQAATNPAAAEQLALINNNKAAADSFLTAVRGRDGIQEMDNGVLYTVNTPGEGDKPTSQSNVTIQYTGKFIDDTIFDQSRPGEPVTYPIRNFVEGFRSSILDMQPGESRTIYLPPHLAYGLFGSPGPQGQDGIPPNAALVFDITLISFDDTPLGPPPMPLPNN